MKASPYKIGTPRRLLVHRGNERRLVAQHPRRRILRLAAGAAAFPAISRISWAQAYPTRPVRIIVGSTPGGAQDIAARLIGQWLSERLARQFIVDNRPGASTNIGTEAVVRASPDGYTLLLVGTVATINPALYEKLNFVFLRDIAPIASIVRAPNVMVVHSSAPAGTVPEFIAYAKANPGKIDYGSSGAGTPLHVAGVLFNMMAGVNMVHVPYRGTAPVLADLMGGQLHVAFSDMLGSIEHIRAGRLRALAVTTTVRSPALPGIPTVSDFLPGYEASSWQGVGAR
jgi:tripartite-type tricarboxylate transporter receptor subunit TctC